MGNNIQSWKTKRLDNLIIPINELYNTHREDWKPPQPKFTDVTKGMIKISGGDGLTIKGKLVNDNLVVSEISNTGEGSGTFYGEILLPAFQKSIGILEVIIIWSSSDIENLTVTNGKLDITEIEL